MQRKTAGKIPTIIDEPLSPAIILVLLNAVYFKGAWTDKFEVAKTKNAPFHALNGEIQRPFMTQAGDYEYFGNQTIQAVALPYGNERFAMWLVLPRQKMALNDLIAKLDVKTWQSWIDKASISKGTVTIPKLKLKSDEKLAKRHSRFRRTSSI